MTSPQMQPPEPPLEGGPEMLTALQDQAQAGQAACLEQVKAAMQAGVNPVSIELLELRVRLAILSDALYGDGTPDQLMYEIACHGQFLKEIPVMMTNAARVREHMERQQRLANLTAGVNVTGHRPG